MTDRQQHTRTQKAERARRKAQVNRDKARQKLLQQRVELAQRRAQNREQSEARRDDDSESERNPTAHSTLPSQDTNAANAARNSHSTVPAEPKHSQASSRARLYGRRLHAKANRHGVTQRQNSRETTDE
jgi:hypothetical protein